MKQEIAGFSKNFVKRFRDSPATQRAPRRPAGSPSWPYFEEQLAAIIRTDVTFTRSPLMLDGMLLPVVPVAPDVRLGIELARVPVISTC
jgi:hypothetical protein